MDHLTREGERGDGLLGGAGGYVSFREAEGSLEEPRKWEERQSVAPVWGGVAPPLFL